MDKENKIILPLIITKGYVIQPNNKEEKIDAGRPLSINAINASRDESSSYILVVSQIKNDIVNPKIEDINKIGTLCRIAGYSDIKGMIRIRLIGTKRVSLKNIDYNKGKDYFSSEFEVIEDIVSDPKKELELLKQIMSFLDNSGESVNFIPRTVRNTINVKGVSSLELIDALYPYLNLDEKQQQFFLENNDSIFKLDFIYNQLNELRIEIDVDKTIQRSVSKSSEKAQKEYILREKLKAIKNELGDDDEEADEDNILDKINNNPYPEYIKKKIQSELKRFKMMPQASLEASLIMSYIQTLLQIPWWQHTLDNENLKQVKKILDEDHFGLTDPKKRIVEYLAVKTLTKNLKAPILCFYGPPGVGKTSLGRSIARALDREFFKASLGGISDEAEIRGHRRTYVGSMPGRIISGMKKAGVNNPVFLLDEVDKLASSYKGDPASALLEVLDPEQNYAFNDNYVEEPYDLSKVLFICTANYIENIPTALRDRLEMIEVNSYTELEKIQIAKKFLLKKQIKINGLVQYNISFSDSAFETIIQKYTREAGVRELERKISSILRKIAVDIVGSKDENTEFVVTPKLVVKYLGKPIFENSKKEKNNNIGVVTGLAYTQFGGDILPIEVTKFKGKGNLVLTGKLGDVMKESATIALSYIKANAKKYCIDEDLFEKTDIHIHFPEGAIPKDGPSAGVAITLAILSCLTNKEVSNDVAMTGEVTLRGHALPIGGLREKSLAALRSGITTIIVPKMNEKDVDDLPKEVKKSLKIIYMNCVDDAIKVAFVND